MAENKTIYFEDLASVGIMCPHEDAFLPDGSKVYYRKLKANSELNDSFIAPPYNEERALEADACIQKSLSVFDNLESLINAVFRTPAGKRKVKQIAVLQLLPDHGVIKKTFGPNHHSWWRSHDFDVSAVTIKEIEL